MSYRGVILDVDGTVVRGDRAIPGAAAGLAELADRGLERLFLSNNPTKAPPAYSDRLVGAGFAVEAEEILTAGTVTARYLREFHAADDLFVVGEDGLLDLFDEADLSVVDDYDADVLVASIDRSFDYHRLSEALWVLADESVDFLGTDPDMVIPAAERDIPGSGAVIHAIAGVAGRGPDVVLGKPAAYTRTMALDALGLPASDVLVVGDRLDTDVAFGNDAGMTTVLVTTGVTSDRTLERTTIRPDYVLDSLADLGRVLDDG